MGKSGNDGSFVAKLKFPQMPTSKNEVSFSINATMRLKLQIHLNAVVWHWGEIFAGFMSSLGYLVRIDS